MSEAAQTADRQRWAWWRLLSPAELVYACVCWRDFRAWHTQQADLSKRWWANRSVINGYALQHLFSFHRRPARLTAAAVCAMQDHGQEERAGRGD